MYTVVWNDYAGNECQITFDRREDAELEAISLDRKYDGVKLMSTK